MEYRGQIIHQFDVTRDEALFTSNSRQILLFTKIVLPTLAVITLGYAMLQPKVTLADVSVYAVVILGLGLVYYRIMQRLDKFQEFDLEQMEESLIIMEYGIEFPPFTCSDLDLTTDEYFMLEPIYLNYNQIEKVEISDHEIRIMSGDTLFQIDLDYFPFYSEEKDTNYNEQVDYLVNIFDKIAQNLAKIENRDHPTIIPRAYFKDILRTST